MTVRPYSVLVALLAVCLFATVGYRIGRSERASAADAASTWGSAAAATFSHARSAAYRLTWQRAYRQGRHDGAAAAQRAGAAAGRAAGRSQAAANAAATRALAAALASAPIKLRKGMKTDRCVPIAGGLCEVLGPRVTGKRCPPASVPNVEGGIVCVPRVLLRAARMNAPSPLLRVTH
jgi:hypothetical protein